MGLPVLAFLVREIAMKREQIVTISEFLATTAIVGTGLYVGGPVGEYVVTALGIHLGGTVLERHLNHLKDRWLTSKDGVLNHDIQQALTRAYVKALSSLEKDYFDQGYAASLSDDDRDSIKWLFTYLRERAHDSFLPSLSKFSTNEDVKNCLYLEPKDAQAKLWEKIDAAGAIYSYGDHFGEFFKHNILEELRFWFNEELKTDSKDCNRAWRAFQRMLLEGIRADVLDVRATQDLIREDLEQLNSLQRQLEEIRNTIEHRLSEEPFREALDHVSALDSTIHEVARTTTRTEQKLDSMAADVKILLSPRLTVYSEKSREHIPISSVGRMPHTGPDLFGREDRLRQLNEAWDEPSTNILSLVAWGGVGKSTLINHWLMTLAQEQYRGAQRVLAWSFYTQGVTDLVLSADLFIESALKWFDDPMPNLGTAWEKGERLSRLIKKQRTLLIIDGLEPLQFPPGPREGMLKDPALTSLLRDLALYNPGLCVISSRLRVTELSQYEKTTSPKIDLEPLSPEGGAKLLIAQGVRGTQDQLEHASSDFGGHALALTLLGSYLRIVCDGDINKKDTVSLLEEDEEQGGHAQRVMASYEQWLGEGPELAILRILALFDRPVEESVLHHLRTGDVILGLTKSLKDLSEPKWRKVIAKLRSARLIAERHEEQSDVLDTHPLIREYFGKQLILGNLEAWEAGNNRLYEYYKVDAEQLPETIRGMDRLFSAVIHGCKAGRYQEALHEVYLPRIMRGDEAYAANELGAVGALLSVLSHFFDNREWTRPVQALNEHDQLFVLMEAGRYLTEAKGYASSEVGECYIKAKQLCEKLGDKHRLFEAMLGMCRYYRVRGELATSGRIANDIRDLWQGFGDMTLLPAAQRAVATNAYYIGDFVGARENASLGAITYAEPRDALINAQLDVNEPAISCLGYWALSLWFLGYPNQAREKGQDALARARELGHAHTLAITLLIFAMINQFRRDALATREAAQMLIDLCAHQGFLLWRLAGEILKSWASCHIEEQRKGLAEKIKQNIAAWLDTEARLFTPYWYGILADSYLLEKEPAAGIAAVIEGLRWSKNNGEHWWDAELYRLKGELASLLPKTASLEETFLKAIDVARVQHARSLELRTAISLARLWENEQKDSARKILVSVKDWFAEGFSSADLQDAQCLLERLDED